MSNKRVKLSVFLTEEYLISCMKREMTLMQIAQEVININGGTCSTSTIHSYMKKYGLIPDAPKKVLKTGIDPEKVSDAYNLSENTRPLNIQVINYDPENIVNDFVLLVSDLQIGACNVAQGYDPMPEETITNYVNTFCKNLLELLAKRRLDINNIHLFLLGDIVDGELMYPKHKTINMGDQLKIAVRMIRKIIETLRPYGNNIYVHTVAGNHGRITHSHHKASNWDNVVYDTLEHVYDGDNQVFIDDDRSFVKNTVVGKWDFLYTHGDIIRGMITRTKAINKSVGFNRRIPHDVFLMGHFHTVMYMNYNRLPIIVNGCMYDSDLIQNELAGWESKRMVAFKVGEGDYPIDWLEMIDVE